MNATFKLYNSQPLDSYKWSSWHVGMYYIIADRSGFLYEWVNLQQTPFKDHTRKRKVLRTIELMSQARRIKYVRN